VFLSGCETGLINNYAPNIVLKMLIFSQLNNDFVNVLLNIGIWFY